MAIHARGGGAGLRVAVSAICLCAALAGTMVAIAGAADWSAMSTGKVGSLELSVGANLAPETFPASRQTPVRLNLTGGVREDPDSLIAHPPAIRELQVESAQLEVHTRGIPACRLAQLQATEARAAEKACGSALIGAGGATAQVAFAEQKPIDVRAKLLVFNGGSKDGKTTLYLHTYFPNPISGAIVTTMTVTHLPGGHFGTLAVAKIPQITGGSGSITGFHFAIDRRVVGHHPVSAICEDGSVSAYVEGKFEDGTKATTELGRPCGR